MGSGACKHIAINSFVIDAHYGSVAGIESKLSKYPWVIDEISMVEGVTTVSILNANVICYCS